MRAAWALAEGVRDGSSVTDEFGAHAVLLFFL